MLTEAFDLFAKAAPATVMIRGVLENILSENRLNALFDDVATVQYTRDLTFASVVRLMSQVVMRIRPSVNAAYRQQADELEVTAKCVYDKLGGIEPRVSRELIRRKPGSWKSSSARLATTCHRGCPAIGSASSTAITLRELIVV